MASLVARVKNATWLGKLLFGLAQVCLATGMIALFLPALPKWLNFEYFGRHPVQFVAFQLAESGCWFVLGLVATPAR